MMNAMETVELPLGWRHEKCQSERRPARKSETKEVSWRKSEELLQYAWTLNRWKPNLQLTSHYALRESQHRARLGRQRAKNDSLQVHACPGRPL